MPRKKKLVGRRRLTFRVEFGTSVTTAFTKNDFKVLVTEAVRTILGEAGPSVWFGSFDESQQKGSVIVQASDAHLIWAALSIYGRHFGKPVAVHLNSISEI